MWPGTRAQEAEGGAVATASAADMIADLRHRRRELRRELAQVRWWRRLVAARRDLVVAYLARPAEPAATGLDLSWEALAAGAPTPAELSMMLWPEAGGYGPDALARLDSLDERLAAFEARVASTLDTVTAQMVRAMAAVHRREAHQPED